MKVTAKIKLASAITGQEIIHAVRDVAGNDYYNEMEEVNDDGVLFDVGRSSAYPYEDCRILTEGMFVDPSKSYTEIEVVFFERGGSKYPIGYNNEEIVRAVRDFRDKLQAKLKP